MTIVAQPTGSKPEVIIAGAGPVGSYAALNLAKLGVKVTVFEEHPQIGIPSHCAGHISIRSLSNMGLYPLPKGIVENTFRTAHFYSPKGSQFSIYLSRPVTAALNRALFDDYLSKQAETAGAQLILSSRVQSLVKADGFIKGVSIKQKDGKQKQVLSKITIDSEGISSRLLRQAGLRALKSQGLVYAVEAEVENLWDVEEDSVEVYLGRAYAPGFYGWLIPRIDGTAKIGLATNKGDPRDCLRALMTKHPIASEHLKKSKMRSSNYHAITLGGPIEKTYNNGFLAVGDCASQVKPTTGGGVIFGLTCAKIAADTAFGAIQKGDVSSSVLQVYQKRCSEELSFDFNVMLRLRRFLDSLSDEKVDEMLRVCSKLGVGNALRNENEIDFQGKMLLQAVRKPSMLAAFMYFAVLYLSTNP